MPDVIHNLRMARQLPCMWASGDNRDGCVCAVVTAANAALGDSWFVHFLHEATMDVDEDGTSTYTHLELCSVHLVPDGVINLTDNDSASQQSDSADDAQMFPGFDIEPAEVLAEAMHLNDQLEDFETEIGKSTDSLRHEIGQFEHEPTNKTLAELKLATKAAEIVRNIVHEVRTFQREVGDGFPWDRAAKHALSDLAKEMGMKPVPVSRVAKQDE